MKTDTPDDGQEIELLKRIKCPSNVIDHAAAVKRKAMDIVSSLAEDAAMDVDAELVRRGALLHDIGRSITHRLNHAVEGARLARELGLDEALIGIIERHIGSGITKEEAIGLGLPAMDYLPATREEKIVSYADSLTNHTTHLTFEDAFERLSRLLGKDHAALGRFRAMHEEILSWMRRN